MKRNTAQNHNKYPIQRTDLIYENLHAYPLGNMQKHMKGKTLITPKKEMLLVTKSKRSVYKLPEKGQLCLSNFG